MIDYSAKYQDGKFEYQNVTLPAEDVSKIPKGRTLTSLEWIILGVTLSPRNGWEHYSYHSPEPRILLFRRPLGIFPRSGQVDPEMEREEKECYLRDQLLHQRHK